MVHPSNYEDKIPFFANKERMIPMDTTIVMFAYNRPSTTKKVIEALSKQTIIPSNIIVFIDMIKSKNDQQNYDEVISIFEEITWTNVKIYKRTTNFGCAKNVVSGLNQIFQDHKKAIVVEDDILVSPNFYESLCLLLDLYETDKSVFSVGGYPSILPNSLNDFSSDIFLSPRFSSWGWGTWSNRWNNLDLSPWKNPYSSISEIPLTAGDDIQLMANELEKNPDFYWDIKVALLNLYNNKVNALTKYYLVNNIGLDSGDHPNPELDINKFAQLFNPIKNRIPNIVSEPIQQLSTNNINQKYIDAVRDYNNKKTNSTTAKLKSIVKNVLKHT